MCIMVADKREEQSLEAPRLWYLQTKIQQPHQITMIVHQYPTYATKRR